MYEEHYDEDGFKLYFDVGVSKADKQCFMRTFRNVSQIAERKVHCTSCQTHIGTAPIAEAVIRKHPILAVTQCSDCHDFYNSGEFLKGEDGSELYCRWCGQGGEVYCCSRCPFVFCKNCILKNLSRTCLQDVASNDNWSCFRCAPGILSSLRAQHWALVNFIQKQKKEIKKKHYDGQTILAMMKEDKTTCCSLRGKRSGSYGGRTSQSASKRRTSSIPEESDSGKDSPKPSTSKAATGSTKNNEDSLPPVRSLKVVPAHLLLSQPQVILNSVLAKKEKTPNARKTKGPVSRKKQLAAANQLDRIMGKKLLNEEYRAGKRSHESQKVSKTTDPADGRPSAKKAKHSNDEVVCTPDIMGLLSPVVEIPPLAPILRKAQEQEKVHSSEPGTSSSSSSPGTTDHSIDAAAPSTASNRSKTQPAPTTEQVVNIRTMHDKLQQYLGAKDSSSSATPKSSKLPLPIQVSSSVNRTTQAPVYHIINGFRVDLHMASQQSTYRLPDGKLIQVRKQKTGQPESVPNSNESDETQGQNQARAGARSASNGMNCSYTVTSLPSALSNASETPRELPKGKRMFSVHQTLPKGHPQLANNDVQHPQPNLLITNQRMPVKQLRFHQLSPQQLQQQQQQQQQKQKQPQPQQQQQQPQQSQWQAQLEELQRPGLQMAPLELQQQQALQQAELQRGGRQPKPPQRPLLSQLQSLQQPQLQQQPLQPQILLQSSPSTFQQQFTLQQQQPLQQQMQLQQQQQPLQQLQLQNSNALPPQQQQILRLPPYLEISTYRPPFPAEQQALQAQPFQSTIVTQQQQQQMQPQPLQRPPQPQYQPQIVVTAVRPQQPTQQPRKRGRPFGSSKPPATTISPGAAATATTNNNLALTARPPLLNTLRDMVNGPHPNSPLGKGQKQFEAKLLVGAETCNQIMGKIATLAGSQSVRQVRHLRDLKELYLHMSYLLTYGVRRLQGLQQQCIEDVRALGFENASDFLLTDVATNATSVPEETDKSGQQEADGNPDDDDENDCEIIEQRAPVIEVDSDDDDEESAQSATPQVTNTSTEEGLQVAGRFEIVSGEHGNYDCRPIESPLPEDRAAGINASNTQSSNDANSNGQSQNTEQTAAPEDGDPGNASKQSESENSSATTKQAPNNLSELVELIELSETNDGGTGSDQGANVGQETLNQEAQPRVNDGANVEKVAPTVEQDPASPSKANNETLSGSELMEQLDSLMDQGLLDDQKISDVSKDGTAVELVEICPNEVSELLNNQMGDGDTLVEREQNNQTNQEELEKGNETNGVEEMDKKQMATDASSVNNESNSVLEKEAAEDSPKPTKETTVVEAVAEVDAAKACPSVDLGKESSKTEENNQSVKCTVENEKQDVANKDESDEKNLEDTTVDVDMKDISNTMQDKADIVNDSNILGEKPPVASSVLRDTISIVDLALESESVPLEDAGKDVEMKDQSNSLLESNDEISNDPNPVKGSNLEGAESPKQTNQAQQLETEYCSEREQSTGKEESFSGPKSTTEVSEKERQDIAKETVEIMSEMSPEHLNDSSTPGGVTSGPSVEHSSKLEADKTKEGDDIEMPEVTDKKINDNVETSSTGSSEGFRSPETILSDSFPFDDPSVRITGKGSTLEEMNDNEETSISAGGEGSQETNTVVAGSVAIGEQNSANDDLISLESISNEAWEDSEQDGTQDGVGHKME